MISAGKTIKDFSNSEACRNNDQCVSIFDKVTVRACGIVSSELVVDPSKAKDEYAGVIGVVYEDKDGVSTAPTDGDYDNFSNVCIDHILSLPFLPNAGTPGYLQLYAAGNVTAADIATFNALMSKKAKTAEECAKDEKVPDGKGECKACPDDTEFKGVTEGCVAVKEGPRSVFLELEGGLAIPTSNGYSDTELSDQGYGDFGIEAGGGGSQTSDLAVGMLVAAKAKFSSEDQSGWIGRVGVMFFNAWAGDVEDANGETSRSNDYMGFVGVEGGVSNAIDVGENWRVELGLDTAVGRKFYDLMTTHKDGKSKSVSFDWPDTWLLRPFIAGGRNFGDDSAIKSAMLKISTMFETPLTKDKIDPANPDYSDGGDKFGFAPWVFVSALVTW